MKLLFIVMHEAECLNVIKINLNAAFTDTCCIDIINSDPKHECDGDDDALQLITFN